MQNQARKQAMWAILVVSGAFAGSVASHAFLQRPSIVSAQSGSPLPPPPTRSFDREKNIPAEQFEEVVRRIAPAVVSVDAVKSSTPVAAGKKPTEESGSGIIIKPAGTNRCHVVTNNHVVGGAKTSEITVTLADGRIMRPDRVWTDPESDVAVLRLPEDNLPFAEFADSSSVRVGQWVLAFGSPFGLNQTVTHGIVSALERGQISLGNTIRIKEFLQTDAAINPGSSGGPLVDMQGRVIGINTAIASNNGNNSGVSFSIPSNLVKRVTRELLEKGTVSRGYLGLQLAPSLEPAAALRLGLTRAWGAMVDGVHPEGPASVGGILPGDVILKLDSVDIKDENHLINLISSLPPNQQVRVTVWRNQKSKVLEVVVGDWSAVTAKAAAK